jgi:D-alanyl-D-alanine dipeptidase
METRRHNVSLCLLAACGLMLVSINANAGEPLVDIQSVDPTIVVELRYAGNNNFLKHF